MLLGLFVWFLVALPFLWPVYKHWRTAKEMVPIHDKAQEAFRKECDRLGIRCTKEFSDVYSTSFIRWDDKSECIAVYAGRSNRFSVIPYTDYFMVLPGIHLKGGTITTPSQYVTTQIGKTSVTTKYGGEKVFAYRACAYEPQILTSEKVQRPGPAFVFDKTEDVGERRLKKTKEFCETANAQMRYIKQYAYESKPNQSYAEWKKIHDAQVFARKNEPDPYGNYHLK